MLILVSQENPPFALDCSARVREFDVLPITTRAVVGLYISCLWPSFSCRSINPYAYAVLQFLNTINVKTSSPRAVALSWHFGEELAEWVNFNCTGEMWDDSRMGNVHAHARVCSKRHFQYIGPIDYTQHSRIHRQTSLTVSQSASSQGQSEAMPGRRFGLLIVSSCRPCAVTDRKQRGRAGGLHGPPTTQMPDSGCRCLWWRGNGHASPVDSLLIV